MDVKAKTVYIAGKVTGDDYYRLKFYAAAYELEKAGYIVLNPAILPDGFSYDAYINISGAMMDACDMVFFLHDWADSRGAMYEMGRAIAHRQPIVFLEEWRALMRNACAATHDPAETVEAPLSHEQA